MKLHSGLIGAIVFSLMRFFYCIQKSISWFFWRTIIKVQLAISKILNADYKEPEDQRRSELHNFTVLDLLKWHHRALWSSLQWTFKLNSLLSGVALRFSPHQKLITWNPEIQLLGFIEDRTTFTIQTLGAHSQRGRSTNFVWLGTHTFNGSFKIIEKRKENDSIAIDCVWTSGNDLGKIFTLGRIDSLGLLNEQKDMKLPSAIYYPPRLIIFGFEALLSLTAFAAIIQLIRNAWEYVKPFYGSSYEFVHILIVKTFNSVESLFRIFMN